MVTTPLTIKRLTPYSGRNVAYMLQVAGNRQKPPEFDFLPQIGFSPLTPTRVDPTYPISAGRSHLRREDTRPRYPLTDTGVFLRVLFDPGLDLCCR